MAEKTKNHFIPQFIINKFSIIKDKDIPRISFLTKSKNIVNQIPSKTQCQSRYFYSKETISSLLNKFQHINLNPIFSNTNKTLEISLDKDLEDKLGVILSKYDKNKNINIFIENEKFIKEYLIIQFLRTNKFKESINEIKKTEQFQHNIFQKNLKEKIINESNFPKDLLENLFNTPKYEKIFKKHTNIACSKFKQYRDFKERHSVEIISKRARDDFFEFYGLKNKKFTLLINKTNIPFILSDWGTLVTELIKEHPNGNKTKEYEFYLSISPNLTILFSNNNNLEIISENFVKEINKLLYEECYKVVYSGNYNYLKTLTLSP